MLKINDFQQIVISKGDSVIINVNIDGADGHEIKSTLFRVAKEGERVFSKPIVSGQLNLLTEDTINLETGHYDYDIVVTFANDEQYTLNYPNKFVVREVC